MASEKIITLTKDNFEQEVIKSDKPILVDFWAPWCGPCRAVGPLMDELAEEFDGKAKVGKINVDEQGELAATYRVMSIPTVMLFNNGNMTDKVIGSRTKNEFAEIIKKSI